jgi:hypothetical protein
MGTGMWQSKEVEASHICWFDVQKPCANETQRVSVTRKDIIPPNVVKII